VNAFVQQGRGDSCCAHHVADPKFDELGLPHVLKDVAMTKRGLVIFVGGTGSGKSTSLAAMIGTATRTATATHHHRGPVEYVHEHKNCIITQREVGVDTDNWFNALRTRCARRPT